MIIIDAILGLIGFAVALLVVSWLLVGGGFWLQDNGEWVPGAIMLGLIAYAWYRKGQPAREAKREEARIAAGFAEAQAQTEAELVELRKSWGTLD